MAPIMFVLFHVLRQLLFIPVAVVCLAGGMLFWPAAWVGFVADGFMAIICCLLFHDQQNAVPAEKA